MSEQTVTVAMTGSFDQIPPGSLIGINNETFIITKVLDRTTLVIRPNTWYWRLWYCVKNFWRDL